MRTIRCWSSLTLFLAAGLACLQGQDAPVAGGTAIEPAGFRTYGDLRSVDVEEELETLRNANEGLVGSVARRPVTFAVALAKARALAQSAVEPASFAAALKALPDNEAPTLRLFAFAQLAAHKPSAAFAVLVAAHDRAP